MGEAVAAQLPCNGYGTRSPIISGLYKEVYGMSFGCPVSPLQFAVICRLVYRLEAHNVTYQITGGLAGNIHGSEWPLQDIDIDVAAVDMPRLAEIFAPHVTEPLGSYVDEEFDLQRLQLAIGGVRIDISQAEEGYGITSAGRQPITTDLRRRAKTNLWGLELYVQPLEDIILYKALIGRSADLKELQILAKEQAIDLLALALA
jgi:hypothetical protein